MERSVTSLKWNSKNDGGREICDVTVKGYECQSTCEIFQWLLTFLKVTLLHYSENVMWSQGMHRIAWLFVWFLLASSRRKSDGASNLTLNLMMLQCNMAKSWDFTLACYFWSKIVTRSWVSQYFFQACCTQCNSIMYRNGHDIICHNAVHKWHKQGMAGYILMRNRCYWQTLAAMAWKSFW